MLAGGDGRRLEHLTRDARGRVVPKQFCSLAGPTPLVRLAVERAARVTERERIAAVVAVQHRQWWRRDLRDLAPENIVVQPANRGTAPGLLLPLLQLRARAPEAVVVAFPADHYVADEARLADAAHVALTAVQGWPQRIALLGLAPESPDESLGWIVPEPGTRGVVARVQRFVEKPSAAVAAALQATGGLWNSFVFAARAETLIQTLLLALPEWRELAVLSSTWRGEPEDWFGLRDLYARLPTRDLSRDVFERMVDRLLVVPVPPCGWTDLGTEARVARCTASLAPAQEPADAPLRAALARAAALA